MSFHVHSAELNGLQLIEASAGTGKTWTIAALYARLVLQSSLSPEQILVVTYTRAATAELRGRIRARLASLVQAFATGLSDDEFEQGLLDSVPLSEHAAACERLRVAVSSFDAAAVYTIHGFCQHALAEHALPAGLEFDRTFVGDERELLQTVTDAAWKAETEQADPAWLQYLLDHGETPDKWAEQLGRFIDRTNLRIEVPRGEDFAKASERFQQLFQHAAAAWRESGAEATEWLLARVEQKQLNGRTHQKRYVESSLRLWSDWLRSAATPVMPSEPSEAAIKRLFAAEILDAGKGALSVPTVFEHFEPLASAAVTLINAGKARLATSYVRLLDTLRAHLHVRKAELGVMSYHDLLQELDEALQREDGDTLAQALATRYQAALIDEFQDTDPLQFRIFDRIFGQGSAPCFLVGDPKQAIYAFRGAELHAYLAARDRVPAGARHTLATNRRSRPALVAAVEQLFTQSSRPFLIDGLDFPHVSALEGKPALRVNGDEYPALCWDWLGDKLGKGDARDLAVQRTADLIAVLLSPGCAWLDDKPLTGGDIAILASKHADLEALHAELATRDIPSVRISRESVFNTPEARDLLQILSAIVEPNESRVRTALMTVTMLLDANALQAALDDEAVWEQWWNDFQQWHALFVTQGAMAALEGWLLQGGVAERTAMLRDGERRLTNLLHLFELIETAHQERSGVGPLLSWYRDELSGGATGEDDERLMRLESDASRVRLVTIHAAKGLEFPVVFCPFLWDGQLLRRDELPLCYEGDEAVLDLGSEQAEVREIAAQQERLAEKLRLLYVALTRPVAACFVAWGEVKEIESSALAWLLAKGNISKRDGTALHGEIAQLIGNSHNHMGWLPDAAKGQSAALQKASPPDIELAAFNRHLAWQWRMSSFSALTAGLHDERPEHDLLVREEPTQIVYTGRFDAFPAGPRAGVCLHTLFERWDFGATDREALVRLCSQLLSEHGFDTAWTACMADMVESTLTAPLVDGLCLRGMPNHAKLVELEFTYKLRPFGWSALAQLLARPEFGLPPVFAKAAQSLSSHVASGYLKGFIDLACQLGGRHYILDWKSNRLEAYTPPALEAAMAAEHYYLQALIYCVALHRYLRWRQPDYDFERDFGGAIYVFLRGMDADLPGQGVWHYRPSLALIAALENLLCGDAS